MLFETNMEITMKIMAKRLVSYKMTMSDTKTKEINMTNYQMEYWNRYDIHHRQSWSQILGERRNRIRRRREYRNIKLQ